VTSFSPASVLRLSLALLLLLAAAHTTPVRAQAPPCTACHRESVSPADPEGAKCDCRYFCKEKYYTTPEGMHGNMPCSTCHPTARYGAFPHEGEVKPVNCTMCHPKQTQVLATTVHNEEALRAVDSQHVVLAEGQSYCIACHPPHAGQGRAEPAFAKLNRRSRPCVACHDHEGSTAVQVHGYEHPLHVFDAEGPRWGALTTLPLFDNMGRVVEPGQRGALTCNSCHSNHGPDADPDHLRRPGWQKACAACHGADSLALYRYFHKPQRREHIEIEPVEPPPEEAAGDGPCDGDAPESHPEAPVPSEPGGIEEPAAGG
jgi:hypothetical protein